MHFVCVNTNDIINNDMNSHLVKIFPVASSANLSDGSSGSGGLDVTRKGHIYFTGAFGMKNGFITSVYGMVRDENSQGSAEAYITVQSV